MYNEFVLAAFLNPYKTAAETELYIILRREAIEKGYTYSEDLNDKYLDLDLLEEQLKQQETDTPGASTAEST